MLGPTPYDFVVLAQTGDCETFGLLYTAYKKRVYSLCFRMTRDRTEAEDLSQEVFLHLLRVLPSFRHEADFGTWLHRVATNVILGKLRLKQLTTVSLDEPPASADGSPSLQFGMEDPSIVGAGSRIALQRGIHELPTACRVVFLLHDVYGCEKAEITEMLQIDLERVKALLHKARLNIRKSLLKRMP